MTTYVPQWKIEIGSSPLEFEMEGASRISTTSTVYDDCGLFSIVFPNPDGKYKSDFSLYDEVKVYVKYADDTAYTQIFGGHLEKISARLTDQGDMLLLSGRSYEHQFFFKEIYDTWMFEHWSDILADVVGDVNANISSNFTTNFLANLEQTTDNADTVDIDDLYDGTEVVGQVIKPNEAYLSTVVVKGYKSSGDQEDDIECRLYRCKDSGGTDTNTLADVDWSQTIGGSLLGSSSVAPDIITEDSDNPQEISFQLDVSGLDTDNLYMLVFAKATTDTGEEYYLRYNTGGGYTDGDYFADGSRVSGDDLWFKVNAFCVTFEDKDAFSCMRDICGKIQRDWYSTVGKEVNAIERYGTSVKTFTVGSDNIISCNIDRDIKPMKNKIIVTGIPRVLYIPSDKDLWTEDSTYWTVDYDETASNTSVSSYQLGLQKKGTRYIGITRSNTGSNTKARIEYPDDAVMWTAEQGLNYRVKAIGFWITGSTSNASGEILRFGLRIIKNSGTNIYKDIYFYATPTTTSLSLDQWQFVTIKLPEPGYRRKWMDEFSDDSPELITWDDAADMQQGTDNYIKQIGIHLYADNDGVTDGTIVGLLIDGLHFILEDENRIIVNDSTSQSNFDTREVVIRDEVVDNLQTAEQKANFIRRLRGNGTESWSGTPGDTKDVQLVGNLTVTGNTDVDAGDTITIVYANGNISMAFRVHTVSHNITAQGGWRTSYELAMLLPQSNPARAIASYMNKQDQLEQRKQFASNGHQQLNVSVNSDESEF